MPALKGKQSKECINAVSYNTMLKLLDMIDFDKMEKEYLEGKKEYEKISKGSAN